MESLNLPHEMIQIQYYLRIHIVNLEFCNNLQAFEMCSRIIVIYKINFNLIGQITINRWRTAINNHAIATIKVSVIYFAQIHELTGIREEEVIIEKGSTLTDLISKIGENHPSLLKVKENTEFAINCNLVRKNLSLNEGDQIAVFPPVAGG